MVKYCDILSLRTCRKGYSNARAALSVANKLSRAAAQSGRPIDAENAARRPGFWLGRCGYWRARLRRAVRKIEAASEPPVG